VKYLIDGRPIADYPALYSSIFGPNLGVDPTYGANTFTPDYAALYKPITPAQYRSFSGYVNSYSRTEDSLFRP
jgi:hypothetical protein